ncbi:hypothetical protein FA13DRAFT_817075 [Coprinellus micaceus]|uniref:Uncharacterized protein n=1 Tax=Coprinellus micaceus TaxID=71717 RepID=A0A4Y7T2M4_COPMI|nr:hypothetical protein FA13DRAFT_817075 [Coprinellus micaceus]
MVRGQGNLVQQRRTAEVPPKDGSRTTARAIHLTRMIDPEQSRYSIKPSPRTPCPSRGMSTPSSFQPGFYGSYGPYSTLPTIAVQSPQTSAANDLQDRDRRHSFNPRDDQEEEVQSNPDDDEWQISDDEEVEEPEPHAGHMMNNVYIPRLLEWMATQHPSYSPSRTELLNLWEEYVPETPLHGGLQMHIITSAGDRIRAWRDGFLAQALEYLERHVRPRLGNDDPEVRRRWAQSMKPSGRKRPPYSFYFKDPEKRTGSFLSDFIAFTMSSHLRATSAIPPAGRSPAFPVGALALALQAVSFEIPLKIE